MNVREAGRQTALKLSRRRGGLPMMRTMDGRQRLGRRLASCFGLATAAMLLLSAGPSERAAATSLINPAAVPSAKHVSEGLMIEVHGRGGGGGGRGGGGGGYRGGGFRGGAVHFSGGGGGYRAGSAFRGGGVRYGAFRSSGYRYGGYRIRAWQHFSHPPAVLRSPPPRPP